MWACSNCREIIEDQFDSCWKCGWSREGKLNLDFMREPTDVRDNSPLAKTLGQHFKCQKCEHRDARIERVATAGTGFAKMLAKDFVAVSCQNCGYTELFNLTVLEGRSGLENFFRGLFGS